MRTGRIQLLGITLLLSTIGIMEAGQNDRRSSRADWLAKASPTSPISLALAGEVVLSKFPENLSLTTRAAWSSAVNSDVQHPAPPQYAWTTFDTEAKIAESIARSDDRHLINTFYLWKQAILAAMSAETPKNAINPEILEHILSYARDTEQDWEMSLDRLAEKPTYITAMPIFLLTENQERSTGKLSNTPIAFMLVPQLWEKNLLMVASNSIIHTAWQCLRMIQDYRDCNYMKVYTQPGALTSEYPYTTRRRSTGKVTLIRILCDQHMTHVATYEPVSRTTRTRSIIASAVEAIVTHTIHPLQQDRLLQAAIIVKPSNVFDYAKNPGYVFKRSQTPCKKP